MSKISVEREGHVLLIGMNRPEKRNALDLDMYWKLAAAYGELQQRVFIRKSAGAMPCCT